MEMNIQGFCRVCTSRNIEMISIYEHYMFYEQCQQIFKVIVKCASIQIQKHDGFSEHICKSCMEHLCQAYGFKRLCEDSDYKFRNNLVVGDKIVPQGAYCDNVIKIQSANEINEKLGYTSSDVRCEIKSEIYEDETKIEYGIVENQIQEENVERASIDSTLQNLKCELSPSLHEIKPILGEDTKIHWINDNNFDVKSKETKSISNKLQEFTNVRNLNDDLSSFRETVLPLIPGENPYKCEECGECFTEKINLYVHKKIHTEEKFFKCETCNIYFGRKQALNDHNNIHIGDKSFRCEICNKSFIDKGNLSKHVKIHSEDQSFKCEVCNRSFNFNSNLKVHMKIHTGDKPYKCEFCNKYFRRKQALNDHIIIHTGDKPFNCEVCNKSFNLKSNLKVHMKIHTGDKPFKCEFCDKFFLRKEALNDHVNIHTGDKPFNCEVCNKSFNCKSNLKIHIKIHTGVKQYKCGFCEKCFRRKQTLNDHIKIHTGDKPYECEVCSRTFTIKSNLAIHKRIHARNK